MADSEVQADSNGFVKTEGTVIFRGQGIYGHDGKKGYRMQEKGFTDIIVDMDICACTLTFPNRKVALTVRLDELMKTITEAINDAKKAREDEARETEKAEDKKATETKSDDDKPVDENK